MERKSELTKALLGEKFKELVAKKGFEKLTIKMITDAAGVIRPTFYNYFGSIIFFVGLTLPRYRLSKPSASLDMNLR